VVPRFHLIEPLDSNILGVRPDFRVEIRDDILGEIDGPMLKYGLQEMHGERLLVPRKVELRPSTSNLEERYSSFLA
jgi:putative restriction endonuclease